jgi:microcystin-dependent protein
MPEPYVGEIRMFAGNFAPAGWMLCQGQTLSIAENEVLFQLIGTTYGGDGQSTFDLPNLASRVPNHQGNGFILGQTGGEESVTLTTQQIPAHNHLMIASADAATQITGANGVVASAVSLSMYFTAAPDTALNANTLMPVGGSQPHTNLQPLLAINFIISLFGVFPSPT